ncbi:MULTISPECIES: TRAP transporter fused permease subunit [unclassified Paenibacillus]|uniref:TRAP transporter permease n=1 Tax=unclassified Paenibacillus TaxID=185978 RepID=UPI001AE6C247|nr:MULTISPECIES: TRAP transporter fused permease subunit [unclassified Paenibacillus]MBP1155591.1 TRAP transporter 4TM/12TM fusion protein [Paenibacillus sp. PvP091]MBP1169023.1 TRAP transporter 4TM/12TM fusion protein [Paenibacillus sp. PvR098]MBP2440051.1 TRAP transporter 4TM/12TM fusion protein [Paenibacillus sp. PvP052]
MQYLKKLLLFITYAFSFYHLYTGFFGSFETFLQRFVHLFLAMLLIFMLHPYKTVNRTAGIILNSTMILLTFVSMGYLYLNYDYILGERYPMITPLTATEAVLGIVMIALVLEATRKLAGPSLPIIALLFLVYGLIGPYLPGIFSHAGYSLDSIIDLNYMGTDGTFGIPLGASASYIALFILFGSFLAKSGLGSLLMELALGLAGHTKGGPAKVAVIGSVLHGMLSGSAVANVMTVGTSTIPLMKKTGYKPHFAGAVEAAASAGSQIMPPVMGVIAFIMVQYTGIPYIQIAFYALLPALLYFWGVGVMVHLEAVKLGLEGLPKKELPDWKNSFKRRGHLLLPIVIMLGLLVLGFSPSYSVTYAILSIVIIAAFRKETRMNFQTILDALQDGAKGMLMIAAATATAGMISGMFGLTGLGLRFSISLGELAGGNLLLALALTAVTSFILGLGLPPSASYIVQIAVTIPALIGVLETTGVDSIASNAVILTHMFVMYWASVGVITPPDALAAYAAAAVAETPPMITALSATRLAFVAYVVPFMFVLNPAYLLIGSVGEISLAIVSGFLGVIAFGIVFQGYIHHQIGWFRRSWALIAGVLIIVPNPLSNIAGICLIVFLLVISHRRNEAVSLNRSL